MIDVLLVSSRRHIGGVWWVNAMTPLDEGT
jgi:hypothetical protein